MKVEKINENKVRITLTFDELEKRDISLSEIEHDSLRAKELFFSLIEESNLDNDFIIDESHLFIEACSDNNNLFIVTITKIDNIPELSKYSFLQEKKDRSKSQKKKQSPNKYRIDSNIFSFNSIDNILEICSKSKKENLFFGRNSLYKYNNTYYVIFSKATIKNRKFVKTYVFLSEYCNDYYSYDLFEISIIEKSKLIIKNNALQKLSEI